MEMFSVIFLLRNKIKFSLIVCVRKHINFFLIEQFMKENKTCLYQNDLSQYVHDELICFGFTFVTLVALQFFSLLDFTSELDAVGIVPHSPPCEWDWDVSHLYQYSVTPKTAVRFLAQRYRVSVQN